MVGEASRSRPFGEEATPARLKRITIVPVREVTLLTGDLTSLTPTFSLSLDGVSQSPISVDYANAGFLKRDPRVAALNLATLLSDSPEIFLGIAENYKAARETGQISSDTPRVRSIIADAHMPLPSYLSLGNPAQEFEMGFEERNNTITYGLLDGFNISGKDLAKVLNFLDMLAGDGNYLEGEAEKRITAIAAFRDYFVSQGILLKTAIQIMKTGFVDGSQTTRIASGGHEYKFGFSYPADDPRSQTLNAILETGRNNVRERIATLQEAVQIVLPPYRQTSFTPIVGMPGGEPLFDRLYMKEILDGIELVRNRGFSVDHSGGFVMFEVGRSQYLVAKEHVISDIFIDEKLFEKITEVGMKAFNGRRKTTVTLRDGKEYTLYSASVQCPYPHYATATNRRHPQAP